MILLKYLFLAAIIAILPQNIAKLTNQRNHVCASLCTHVCDTKAVSRRLEKGLSCI